jgi:copper(I)-binding protein
MMKPDGLIRSGLAALLLVLAACSPAPAVTPTSELRPFLTIEGAYGLLSAVLPGAGEIFLVIRNTGLAADRLLSGRSDACGKVELYQWVMKADSSPGIDPLPQPLDIPSLGQTEFKEGGYYHLLCLDLQADQFKPGAKIRLSLTFDTSSEQRLSVDIRLAAATPLP